MMRIIVNADDFGINEIVTSEIERMIEAGYVTSTSVMANGACLEEVKRFAYLHPEVSFGVHLCLSEYDSTTKSEGLYRAGLTDEKGAFIKNAIFSSKNLDDKNVQEAIKDELFAQIEVVKSLGFPISHADSHHHVHTIYPLRGIFEVVLQSYGIQKIRLCLGFNTLRSKFHILNYIKHILLNRYYKCHFITADAFSSYSSFVNDGFFICDNMTVELMCHPGHPAERYIKEMELVKGRSALKEDDTLISYNELCS